MKKGRADVSMEQWWADQSDDERDATIASAMQGDADDYSYLDGEDGPREEPLTWPKHR